MEMDQMKTAFKEVVSAELNPIKEQLKSAEEKIAKLEAAPAKGQAPAIVTSKKVYGYNVEKMGSQIREKAAKNPAMFKTFSDEEKMNDFSEFMLDVVQATKFRNPAAHQKLFERQEKAAYQEGATSEGGYLVPVEYQWDMIQLAREKTFALNECTVVNMSTNSLKLPKELTLAAVTWDDEEATFSSGEGTFDQVSLTARRCGATATVSNELLQDSAVDVVSILSEQFSYATLLDLDRVVLIGDGTKSSAYTSGIMNGTAGNSVVLSTSLITSLTADKLSDAIAAISEGYLMNAKFVMGKTAKAQIRTLKGSTNDHYIYQQPGAQASGSIWEYPYFTTTKVPALTTGKTAVLFGNMKYFYLGRRLGVLTLDVDPYGKFDTYQTRFRVCTRWGFALANSSAFCAVNLA
jgi:HK97 family phage major capsid protein